MIVRPGEDHGHSGGGGSGTEPGGVLSFRAHVNHYEVAGFKGFSVRRGTEFEEYGPRVHAFQGDAKTLRFVCGKAGENDDFVLQGFDDNVWQRRVPSLTRAAESHDEIGERIAYLGGIERLFLK